MFLIKKTCNYTFGDSSRDNITNNNMQIDVCVLLLNYVFCIDMVSYPAVLTDGQAVLLVEVMRGLSSVGRV